MDLRGEKKVDQMEEQDRDGESVEQQDLGDTIIKERMEKQNKNSRENRIIQEQCRQKMRLLRIKRRNKDGRSTASAHWNDGGN